MIGPGPMASDRDWVIEAGWTFTIKTHVTITRTGVGAQVGERGARRLGHRELRPFATG